MPIPTPCGTDWHTTMINGLGVLGWGVGGIEAEAAMLGQPISMLLPQVVGFRLTGELSEGATATDLVLTVTQMLRERGVVGKFVEFFGPGLHTLGLADRATIGNMSPEFGSTCAIFPVDAETLRYLEFTGRPTELIELVDAYARAGPHSHRGLRGADLLGDAPARLGDVEPASRARSAPRTGSPRRGEQALSRRWDFQPPSTWATTTMRPSPVLSNVRPPSDDHNNERGKPRRPPRGTAIPGATANPVTVTLEDGTEAESDRPGRDRRDHELHNTSNPSVVVAAGLLAKKAVERNDAAVGEDLAGAGLHRGHRLPDRAGLTEYLDRLKFNLVGYGCTTCIGNRPAGRGDLGGD
jgi:aconitate hydratase